MQVFRVPYDMKREEKIFRWIFKLKASKLLGFSNCATCIISNWFTFNNKNITSWNYINIFCAMLLFKNWRAEL